MCIANIIANADMCDDADYKFISSNFIIVRMSLSFNQLNGTTVSDASGNTTLGSFSLQGAESQRGLNNTAMGYGALRDNTPLGQHNIAVGLNALRNNAGNDNLAIGENAMYNFLTPNIAQQTGDHNVAIGNNAIQCNTSGHDNVALGNQALNNNSTGYLNVAIGNNAMQGSGTGTGSCNVAVGNQALNNNATGVQNAIVGMGAAYYNTTGSNNAALGYNAMLNDTIGSDNVAIGNIALVNNQSGDSNVAIGNAALQAHTDGDGNIAIGDFALSDATSNTDNIGVGRHVSANNKNSCILLGNHAQTTNDHELGMAGINLVAPFSPPPVLIGYIPIRLRNYNIGSTAGTQNQQYYIPIYSGPPPPLPVPEVIIANHSSLGSVGSGGVGLLIGFPSSYSAVSSVVISNPNTGGSYTISTTPSCNGYYVFYENAASIFWSNVSLSYANLVQTLQHSTLCGGLVFGNPLTFAYTIGSTTTITYSPLDKNLNISDGYQYQQYNGQAAFTPPSLFQWGGTVTGTPGSENWGEQVGTGTQTYTQWQAVADNYTTAFTNICILTQRLPPILCWME